MRRVRVYDTDCKMIDLDTIVSIQIDHLYVNNYYLQIGLQGCGFLKIGEYKSYDEARIAADHLFYVICHNEIEWNPYEGLEVSED